MRPIVGKHEEHARVCIEVLPLHETAEDERLGVGELDSQG
jgi:hypothetical protein